ncbi:MAG: PQQ-like beta-propeller repeat protein [Deltaproteobacteria bacterium]|nr:PQQ-like beta-propeller repeat protein [Deltaproteobacteria bacterium]
MGRWLVTAAWFIVAGAACGRGGEVGNAADAAPDVVAVDAMADAASVTWEYGVPLAPDSPWPKFRRTARQDGASPVLPSDGAGTPWTFPTGKGIFSTPVIGGDGTVYVGSADRVFYAIGPDGQERWRLETGEIIDSSALLDDLGRVYVGSGDGRLYARDSATGAEVWTFQADGPEVRGAFINWFEGNVALGPDGTLVVPNDNWFVYGIDRDTGAVAWRLETPDQTWSLAAVDPQTGDLYQCNNNLLSFLGDNVFALDAAGGLRWSAFTGATIAASPALTEDGLLFVAGFDGFLRAFDAASGEVVWSFGTRDHLYASPALLPGGGVVQASADGTVYGLDRLTGEALWAFDTLEPIRSSPAVAGDGTIYVGSGEGRLFVLNPDGTLRWSMRLIEGDRNDLNASPALGRDSVLIAGETGEVFRVPLDWCLDPEGAADARCATGGEDLPGDGAHLLFTTRFGSPLLEPPATIDPVQALAFSLVVREAGDTVLALLDGASLQVETTPPVDVTVDVDGGRRFLTVLPVNDFVADDTGVFVLHLTGNYLVEPERTGLRFTGGTPGGTWDATFTFQLSDGGPAELPLPVPAAAGDDAGVWELSRLAAPLPTILPSYNQIGFDSLHWLVGMVSGNGEFGVAWMIGAKPDPVTGATVPDPDTGVLFPLAVTWRDGCITLDSEKSFQLEAMNATLSFDRFRVAARLGQDGAAVQPAVVFAEAVCADIALYGAFLRDLGFCNPDSDKLTAFGAVQMEPWQGGVAKVPPGTGAVNVDFDGAAVRALFTGSALRVDEHRFGVMLREPGSLMPYILDYGTRTTQEGDAEGRVTTVTLDLSGGEVPPHFEVVVLVDTIPVAVQGDWFVD